MRILYINTLYAPYIRGGAEITLQMQAEGMMARGHDVAVLTIGPQQQGTTEERVNGVPVYRAAYKNIYFHYRDDKAPWWQRALWHWKDRDNAAMEAPVLALIDRFKPDVVCCHNLTGWSIAVWRAIRSKGVPFVQVLHDHYLLCPRSTMFSGGKVCGRQCTYCKFSRRKHAEASQQASAVVGVSHFMLNKLTSAGYFIGVETKAAIHNARPGGLPPLPANKDRPSRLTGKTVIGFIGTLSPHKGIELLLQCFASLEFSKNLHLLVAGTGNQAYVEGLKRSYGAINVEFLGQVRPADFYPLLDVTVVPSIWEEPLGNVVFESFLYGVPVIGSNRGGIPEMIEVDNNGCLFDFRDSEALNKKIAAMCGVEASINSKEEIRAISILKFNIKKNLDSFEEVLCLAGKH